MLCVGSYNNCNRFLVYCVSVVDASMVLETGYVKSRHIKYLSLLVVQVVSTL